MKQLYLPLAISSLLCINKNLLAQQTSTLSHQLTAGLHFSQTNNGYWSDPKLNSNFASIEYRLLQEQSSRKKSISISYQQGQQDLLKQYQGMLRYDDAFLMGRKKKVGLQWYLGYAITTDIRYNSQPTEASNKYEWLNTINAGVYSSASWKKNKDRWDIDVYLPIAGLVSRPSGKSEEANNINDLLSKSYSDLQGVSLFKLQAPQLSITHIRSMGNRISGVASIHYAYTHLDHQYSFNQNQYGLQLGIRYEVK